MQLEKNYGIPEILEHDAEGIIKHIFDDIKFVLKVPVVSFIFRTLALYERFLDMAWTQVRPNMLTVDMEEASKKLRTFDISIDVPKINWKRHYNEFTIEKIKKIIYAFNYLNPKLLLILSAWAESLSDRPINHKPSNRGYIQPGIDMEFPDINLVYTYKTSIYLKYLLLDIIEQHNAFDLSSDYRALANYPNFLGISWEYLKPFVGSNEYNLISSELKNKSIEMAHDMTFPITINRSELESIYSHHEITGIMGIISMFQNYISHLIVDGEYFRRIIK